MTISGETRFDGSGLTVFSLVLSAEAAEETKSLTVLAKFLDVPNQGERLAKLCELADGVAAEEETAKSIKF